MPQFDTTSTYGSFDLHHFAVVYSITAKVVLCVLKQTDSRNDIASYRDYMDVVDPLPNDTDSYSNDATCADTSTTVHSSVFKGVQYLD